MSKMNSEQNVQVSDTTEDEKNSKCLRPN